MTPSNLANLADQLANINRRITRLADEVAGTVPAIATDCDKPDSSLEAFGRLFRLSDDISCSFERLERALLDETTNSAVGQR